MLADTHAEQRAIELGQYGAGTQHHRQILTLAAREQLAIDAAFEFDRDAIARRRGARHFGVNGFLAAHALDHRLDIVLADGRHRALDADLLERLDGDFGQHFEYRRVANGLARHRRQRLDARVAGRPQFFAVDGFGKAGLHQIVDGLGTHLAAVLLGHYGEGHLAGAKALEPRGAGQRLQARVDATAEHLARHRDLEAALQTTGCCQ